MPPPPERRFSKPGSGRPARPRPGRRPHRQAPPSSRPTVEIDAPREIAFQVIRSVALRQSYANLLLPAKLRDRRLTGRDAAFATELCYGTLRNQGTLDAILANCADRPLDTVDPALRDVLRLGAYQILHTRVPSHAAVSITVEQGRQVVGSGAARFANAIMRRVTEKDLATWLDLIAPADAKDRIEALALRHAHPAWVVAAFHQALAGDLTETETALDADNIRPSTHLVARPGLIDRDELVEQASGESARYSPYGVYLPTGDPGAIPAIQQGLASVQDEGSQLCALALAGVEISGPDQQWLDLCAGPGGKTALLGALAAQHSAHVLATEVQPSRAELVRKATVGLPVETITEDGTQPSWTPGTFDRVLVDAPCTGLGALRRRAEARWRRMPSDIPELTKLQRALLTSGLHAVRSGGVVAYVTCSPHPAETKGVVAEVLRKADAELLDARPYFPGLPALGPGPYVQLWPHRHGTDAMFCALIRKA